VNRKDRRERIETMVILAFLLGLAAPIPYLLMLFDLSPYQPFIDWNWIGWTLKVEHISDFKAGHFTEAAYTSTLVVALIYAFLIVVYLVFLLAIRRDMQELLRETKT